MAPKRGAADGGAGDLFAPAGKGGPKMPLAARLRPTVLSQVVGQPHLLGPGGPLARWIAAGTVHSAIFFGPPGTGKTTVAQILARSGGSHLVVLSAVESGAGEIKRAAEEAVTRWQLYQRRTVVFIDEIHRLNRAQQDVLLPYVEAGRFVLLGATAENPWATLNPALLSRCQVFEFRPLSDEAVRTIVEAAWARRGEWLEGVLEADPQALAAIADTAGGDARRALSTLEAAAEAAVAQGILRLTKEHLGDVTGPHYHGRDGDRHYDQISALIKSIRGSDPDAALYWLGRLLAGGEDPQYVMRRVLVHAAEDVGLADPRALLVAEAATMALERVGLPEARIPMAEAVLYLALAPKSNSVVAALARLDEVLARHPGLEVPNFLRDRHYRPDIQEPYRYPHAYPGHFVPVSYLPPPLRGTVLYEPGDAGEERALGQRVAEWRRLREAAGQIDPDPPR